MTSPDLPSSYRLELVLRKPAVGWFPKPTVVLNGRGQPAQWGTGTWQVTPVVGSTISVFLFNRLWKFGHAEYRFDQDRPRVLTYRAPLLPLGSGRLTAG